MRFQKTILIFLSIIPFSGFSQIKVESTDDTLRLKNQLFGDGIEIFNFKISGNKEQVGAFNDPIGIVGLRTGIILASGNVKVAEGPNVSGASSTSFGNNIKDPLLDEISQQLGTSYNDAIIVEFDFIPKGNFISFNYVFSSEEYTEHDDEYPDFFGFWISGPDYPTPYNLAKVPNSNLDVSTSTINDKVNKSYYNDNGDGTTPIFNPFLGFDGYTDVLKAQTDVIPCETYHLKMAIADARDFAKDSGVFIETESLTSSFKPILSAKYESSQNTLFEGCADAEVIVNQDNKSSSPIIYQVVYGGEADTNDFVFLPKIIQIEPQSNGTSFPLQAVLDTIEGLENLTISLIPFCDLDYKVDTISLPINDKLIKEVPNFEFCQESSFQLNYFNAATDSVIFSSSSLLSCTRCVDPEIQLAGIDTIYYNFVDKETLCEYSDSFLITPFKPLVSYSIDTSVYYTILDFIGTIDYSNMDHFSWSFNDKNYEGKNVIHQQGFLNKAEVCVDIKLFATQDSLNCTFTKDTSICRDAILNIPNIITPNNDGVNDYFAPEGISPGFWKLSIYNRYGKLVFYDEKYRFDFKAKDIIDGTYYYYLENQIGDRQYKGWLQIIR